MGKKNPLESEKEKCGPLRIGNFESDFHVDCQEKNRRLPPGLLAGIR